MLAKFLGWISKGQYLSLQRRKIKFLCCVHPHHKAGAWNQEVSCRSRATTAKKCIKMRDARAKLLFCHSKPIAFFCHPRCRRHCRCLSSLLLSSKHFATMVTLPHTSPLFSETQSINHSTLFKHGKWLSKLVFRHAV